MHLKEKLPFRTENYKEAIDRLLRQKLEEVKKKKKQEET